jgi:hypothetical protein
MLATSGYVKSAPDHYAYICKELVPLTDNDYFSANDQSKKRVPRIIKSPTFTISKK